jgi:hypothetical protein
LARWKETEMSVKRSPATAEAAAEHMIVDEEGYAQGFEVVVERVIGSVMFTDTAGSRHPVAAAMEVVAGHMVESGDEGTYRFPMDDGRTCVVHTEFAGERR